MTIWEILEVEETNDLAIIKSAYAVQLKKHRPETDPEGFQLVRSAYEAAIKFAKGESVSVEIEHFESDETESEPVYIHEEYSEDEDAASAQELAFYLLNLLYNNQEQEALQQFQEMVNNGLLDNLELSDEFQEVIALRLIDKAQKVPEFTCYLIDYFYWENHREIQKESLLGIALRNLINQTAYYRFLQDLKAKALVASKDEALEKGFDWAQCCAIKTLFSEKRPRWFTLRWLLFRKKRKAIIALLKEIERYRLTSDLDEEALSWWSTHGNTKFQLMRFGYTSLMLMAYVIFVFAKHGKINISTNKTAAQDTQHQAKQTEQASTQRIIPSTSTNIVITLSDNQGKKLNGKNQYMLHIPLAKNEDNDEVNWYVMLFDKDYQMLKNPINNENLIISNNNPVHKNPDGSIDIYLQADKPNQESNWLATPKDNFIVVGQFFWKKSGAVISHWDGLVLTEYPSRGG